jgi:hypothetical protein
VTKKETKPVVKDLNIQPNITLTIKDAIKQKIKLQTFPIIVYAL